MLHAAVTVLEGGAAFLRRWRPTAAECADALLRAACHHEVAEVELPRTPWLTVSSSSGVGESHSDAGDVEVRRLRRASALAARPAMQ